MRVMLAGIEYHIYAVERLTGKPLTPATTGIYLMQASNKRKPAITRDLLLSSHFPRTFQRIKE